MNKYLYLFITSLSLFFTACATNQLQTAQLDAKTEYEIKQTAQKAIEKIAGNMQMTLYHKVKEGGITNAATFCSTNAATLAKKASKMLPEGVTLKRVTNQPRNINNKANAEESLVLDALEAKIKKGEKVDMMIFEKAENHYQVYKPITIQAACLKCHGTSQTRNADAYKIIADKYPSDMAKDYKLYDFRGAFLVDIIR